jgi:glycosyltransferase involved in cell wall biosynthesis
MCDKARESKTLVSVIIPTYNRESYLRKAIQSVINQTYRPIECIIVDDGSTDDTKKMVDNLALQPENDFFIKYIYQTNSGSQVARNTGTQASTGEFIQYLDSDDLLYPEKIKEQVSYLNSSPDVDGVFGDWDKGTPEEKELIQAWESDDMLTQLLTDKVIHTLAFLFRQRIVKIIRNWDVNIKRNQEIDFQVKGLLEGANYRYQKFTCGLWRIHNGERIANTTGSKELLHFYHKWENLLNSKGLFNEQMKRNISNIYFWLAQSNSRKKHENFILLKEAVRLNPEMSFFKTGKMYLFKKVFGLEAALKLWLFLYVKN